MRFPVPAILPAIVLAIVPQQAAASTPPGVWANPANSVHVAFRPCGDAICGTVIWASEKAKDDAARGSDAPLVGTVLFDDFVQDGPHSWNGDVYVPDIGKSLSGTITMTGPRTMIGEGCLFAGVGCKQQTWRRIK